MCVPGVHHAGVTTVRMDVLTVGVVMKPIQPLRHHKMAGHKISDLCLPGDEQSLINYKTKLSIERDNRLNSDEHKVYMCELIRFRYGTRVCLSVYCEWCEGGGWGFQEIRDTWP